MTCSRSTVFDWPVKSENKSGRNAASTGETGEASALVMKPRPFGAGASASDGRLRMGAFDGVGILHDRPTGDARGDHIQGDCRANDIRCIDRRGPQRTIAEDN